MQPFRKGERAVIVNAPEAGVPTNLDLHYSQVVEVLMDQFTSVNLVLVRGDGRFSFEGQVIDQWVEPHLLRRID